MEGNNNLSRGYSVLSSVKHFFEKYGLVHFNYPSDLDEIDDEEAGEIQKYLLENTDRLLQEKVGTKEKVDFSIENGKELYETLNLLDHHFDGGIDSHQIHKRLLESGSNAVKYHLDNSSPEKAIQASYFVSQVLWNGRCDQTIDWNNPPGDIPVRSELFEEAVEYCADSFEEGNLKKAYGFMRVGNSLKESGLEFPDLSGEHERAAYAVANKQQLDDNKKEKWEGAIERFRNLVDPNLF